MRAYTPDSRGAKTPEEQCKKKTAATKKVVKSKSTIESDDDIEIITGNSGNNSNEVDASDKMLVDDKDKPVHDIGVVPKGLRFKKLKVDHDCAYEDHPEAFCLSAPGPSTRASKSKRNNKKRKLRDNDDYAFISAVLKSWAKLITSMPSDLPNTIPAIKKRLYQFMVEIAVINDRIHSDITLCSSHVEDAAALAARLSELETAATDE
ncbi:hypothetical protein B0H13DRAFT_2357944 [Mycena leptocephala]|nr:hypothetical protein B0H13DRAFT_2365088 [Mycena leptocephala]KAJ7855373.1 hypothetical protein B0H13DRAFT_2357944 [Mycena leptocephala]